MYPSSPISGPIDLEEQVAIVTGAARGIGRSTCVALAREGASIAAFDVLDCRETLDAVAPYGRKAHEWKCDIGNPEQVKACVDSAFQSFGRVDILVNNASILGDSRKGFDAYTPGDWDDIMRINSRGPFLVTQSVWPFMAEQKAGKIVCIGSIAGRVGGILAGPHYSASKGAIHAFVKWAAKKGAPLGIHVNGIAPGPIETPMIEGEGYTAEGVPLGRLGQPEDIAMAAVFLASQASNFITGLILDVNGGLLMA
ncbi:MAG: SDR family oxidoreductase [Deltaproteobacteria bacterium]|nr:SDR family oxidoreductase [Deltaproteobacteria bacterium]